MLLLSRAEVERLLDLPAMLTALEHGFVEYSAGRCQVPPRVGARSASGIMAAMPGYVPGPGLEVKLVSVFPGNRERGKPSHQALIAIFDEHHGSPVALMDGTYITAIRTGGGAAVSVKALARANASVLAVLGAGVQGRSHLLTVPRVRSFREVRVASRNQKHAAALVQQLGRSIPGLRLAASFEEAVRGADAVCLCTDAAEPVIRLSWLAPGCHVSSVGNNAEIGADLVAGSSVFVEWRGAVSSPPPAGAAELQGLAPASVTELGEVLSGARPGRRSETEITLYKSTGFAVEDAVTAGLVLERARKEGVGTEFAF